MNFPLLFILLALTATSLSACFLPNGTETSSPGAQPCSFDPTNPLAATCCNSGYDNPPGSDAKLGQPRDECLPNGLCQNRGFSTIEGKEAPLWLHYYRVYCTNKDWKGCLSVCDTGLNGNDPVQMTPCDGTNSSAKWCCGDTRDCCDGVNAARAVIVPKMLQANASSSPLISASSSPAATSTPAAQVKDKSAKRKMNIGIGIGIGLGFPIMFALGMALSAFVVKRRGVRTGAPAELQNEHVSELQNGSAKTVVLDTAEVEELATSSRNELYEGRRHAELP